MGTTIALINLGRDKCMSHYERDGSPYISNWKITTSDEEIALDDSAIILTGMDDPDNTIDITNRVKEMFPNRFYDINKYYGHYEIWDYPYFYGSGMSADEIMAEACNHDGGILINRDIIKQHLGDNGLKLDCSRYAIVNDFWILDPQKSYREISRIRHDPKGALRLEVGRLRKRTIPQKLMIQDIISITEMVADPFMHDALIRNTAGRYHDAAYSSPAGRGKRIDFLFSWVEIINKWFRGKTLYRKKNFKKLLKELAPKMVKQKKLDTKEDKKLYLWLRKEMKAMKVKTRA